METQQDEARYKVVRFFRKSGRRRIIMRGVSLAVAQLHCKSPGTSRPGVWFDGFERC